MLARRGAVPGVR